MTYGGVKVMGYDLEPLVGSLRWPCSNALQGGRTVFHQREMSSQAKEQDI